MGQGLAVQRGNIQYEEHQKWLFIDINGVKRQAPCSFLCLQTGHIGYSLSIGALNPRVAGIQVIGTVDYYVILLVEMIHS